MYKAKLVINNVEFIGTLTFEVLINTIRELEKIGRVFTIPSFFKSLGKENMESISALIIQSIVILEKYNENEVTEVYLEKTNSIEQDIENFNNIFFYINELLKKCMPKAKEIKESIFDDEEEFEELTQDWNLAEFEYLWETILKRNNFYKITPKVFFEQLEIHSKTQKTSNSNITEL